MRVALVCRDLGADRLTGSGARIFAAARALARAGHEVYLLSEELPAARARALLTTGAPTWIRVERTRPDHRYLIEANRYADWIYDTLRELHGSYPLDAVEFSDAGAEGLTTIRAKRLLGEFAATTLTVTRNPWDLAESGPPVTFQRQLTGFAERYCAEHADVCRPPAVLAPVPAVRPASRLDSAAARTVWRIGAIRPAAGLGTFLRAAELVLDADPGTRFTVSGDDTGTDPLGRSYWRHVRSRYVSDRLAAALSLAGPLRIGDLDSLPPPGIRCVLPEGAAECPSTAALAMARGYVVLAPAGSTAAEVIKSGRTGIVVPPGNAESLAAALLANRDCAQETIRLARGAAAVSWPDPHVEPARATRVRRGPSGTVSVVIPLYNQGRYLAGAVASVRASGYSDLEVVVVDDGSTNPATLAAFDALTGVIKVRQRNAGLSAARNAGIAASRGEYIVPLDADDELPPGFLAPAVAALRANPELSYVVGYLRYTGLLHHVQAPLGFAGDVSLVLNTHGRATGVFRRTALRAIGGYDESLPAYEDWDLHIRLHRAGLAGDVLPVEGQRYRRHRESMTFSHTNDLRLELLQVLLRKHAGALPPDRSLELLLTMAQLWKTGYEPSASVRLQRDAGVPRNG